MWETNGYKPFHYCLPVGWTAAEGRSRSVFRYWSVHSQAYLTRGHRKTQQRHWSHHRSHVHRRRHQPHRHHHWAGMLWPISRAGPLHKTSFGGNIAQSECCLCYYWLSIALNAQHSILAKFGFLVLAISWREKMFMNLSQILWTIKSCSENAY